MNLISRIRLIDVLILMSIVAFCSWKMATRASTAKSDSTQFANDVRLDPLYAVAVQADGRLRSFESHAKTYMRYISGPRSIKGQSNGFSYLDLMFRSPDYADADIIYIKNKQVRNRILAALQGHPKLDQARADTIAKSGLISRTLLGAPEVVALLQRLSQDLIRTEKAVNEINSALAVSNPQFLGDNLRIAPAPNSDDATEWLSISRLAGTDSAPQDDIHGHRPKPSLIPGFDEEKQKEIEETWAALASAWRSEDAAVVNGQIETLADLLPAVAGSSYPSQGRLATESWYFRNKSMTWVWLLYLAAVIPLLMSIIYKWDGARLAGMVLFCVAFLAHTASIGIRWYISGRWPNSNMFEAVTTSAWFGGVAALVLERLTRRTPFRNLFALGSSVVSMTALMAAYFLPAQLDSSIGNKMAALNDVWLYIHTNMIISSYAVIGLACVPALLMLRHRWCLLWDGGKVARSRLLILPVALGVLNYTAYMLLMHVLNNPLQGLAGTSLVAVSGGFWASLMIVALELHSAKLRRLAGAQIERAAGGGATALIMGRTGHSSFLADDAPTASQVFDGATMVLVELAFIMLWTGLVMGAIWADHSWGRPWGWDPKEVFALNTFIIFIILIHVRLKVRDKGFWTAVIAIVGFEVMMFNWIVVNFVITGLHSYA